MIMPASTSLSMDFSVNPMSTGAKNLGTTSLLENGKTFIDISQNHVSAYDDLTGFEFATAVCPDLRDSTEGLNLEADYYYKSEDPYKDLIEMIQLETKKEIEEVSEFDQILDQVQSQYNSFLKQERKRQEELLNVHPWKHQIDVLFQNHKNANHENEQESGALVNEMITKKNSEVFICFACGRVFSDELLMRKHINDDHLSSKDYPFKCSQCYKKFNLKHHLDRHLKTHNKEHVCTLCNTAFSSFENFIIHKSRVHNLNVSDKPITRQIKCEKCGVQKSSEAELNRHKYWCFNSKKIKKNRLENKIRMSISAPSSTNVSPGGGAIRPKLDKRCEYCNQEFASMQSKIRHFQRKHPDKVDEANKRIYAPMVSPNLQFMCMECHRSFSSHFALKTHQKRHQADSKQFSCDICSRSYILPSELRKHIKRVHEKNDQEPQHTSSTEVSPTGPIKERRGRPPISAQNFAGTPVNLAPIHPTAMLSPQMAELASDFKKLKNVEEEKVEDEDMEREPIEDMPDWNEL